MLFLLIYVELQAKCLLNQKSRKNVYFSFIHSYMNYGNIAWRSTYKTKFKKIFTYQKKTARVIFFADRLPHAKPLMLDMNALNIYQINIYQNLILLYKAHAGTAPSMFFNKFSKINYNYSRSSKNRGNYIILKSAMKLTNFEFFKERSNALDYSFWCNTKRKRIFTTIQS